MSVVSAAWQTNKQDPTQTPRFARALPGVDRLAASPWWYTAQKSRMQCAIRRNMRSAMFPHLVSLPIGTLTRVLRARWLCGSLAALGPFHVQKYSHHSPLPTPHFYVSFAARRGGLLFSAPPSRSNLPSTTDEQTNLDRKSLRWVRVLFVRKLTIV